jgi:hypothetical protein
MQFKTALHGNCVWQEGARAALDCHPECIETLGQHHRRLNPTRLALPRSVVFSTPPTRTVTFLQMVHSSRRRIADVGQQLRSGACMPIKTTQ